MFYFVKHYEFMLAEFGAGIEKEIYARIFSFYEFSGDGCAYSRNQWAQILHCSPRHAQRALKQLAEDGYIIPEPQDSEAGAHLATLYTINPDSLDRLLTEHGMQAARDAAGHLDITPCDISAQPLRQNDATPCDKMSQPLRQNDATPCDSMTQATTTENKTESTNRECESAHAHAHEASDFVKIEGYPEIKLTASEYDYLRYRLDYSKTKQSRTLDTYFAVIADRIANGTKYSSHFAALRKWAMQDGATMRTADDADRMKQFAELEGKKESRIEELEANLGHLTDEEWSEYQRLTDGKPF